MENKTNKTLVCAITGGIGCGKTAVANIIKEMGYKVISSDENAKEIIATDRNVKKKLIDTFGKDLYNETGLIDKDLLSSIVFGNTEEHEKALLKLNSIVHPVVIAKMIDEVEEYEKKGEKLIFVESALTFEAQIEEGFDYIIVVDAKEDIAIDRIKKRSNMKEEDIRYRMKQQLSQELKIQHSDFVIENNGSLDDLKKSVEIIVNILSQLAK
ncbi:MAG: dephospho-CoA kinase [bacterium]